MLSNPTRRALTRPLQAFQRQFSTSSSRDADFTHVVIGGGAVGLSIAHRLSLRPNTSTLLLEKHSAVGTETSSRNSEVIHAGLYYGADSLKTALCVKGKQLMYDFCARQGISHRNTKKWIVAQDQQQWEEIVKVHSFARSIDVPTKFVSLQEARDREPDVRARAGVLESESTGIVDSHGLMACLEGKIQEAGGEIAFRTQVSGLEALPTGGYRVFTKGEDGEEGMTVDADVLVNSAGLFAPEVNNMLLPEQRHVKAFYAKGTYFSYSGPGARVGTLVYPAPVPGHGGLGTHLTLDLSSPPRVRFGPDVEWVDSPNDYTPNQSRMEAAIDDIQTYLPGIDRNGLQVDYCGIRPKLGKKSAVASGKDFQDFVIQREHGFPGFVNLLGIESPGLTSCLAIGEYVDELLHS